ncbi:MAG: hypothetical protein J6L24_02190, partial [Oscillospiraceae bacterium]|nr:hypothetical protein [Oscillospiraceae bacterium]
LKKWYTFQKNCVIIYTVCAGWADPGSFITHNLQAFSLKAAIQGRDEDKWLPALLWLFAAKNERSIDYTWQKN